MILGGLVPPWPREHRFATLPRRENDVAARRDQAHALWVGLYALYLREGDEALAQHPVDRDAVDADGHRPAAKGLEDASEDRRLS
jgi:hypothetical protein